MGRAGLMSACGLSKLLHSAAWSGLPAGAAWDIAKAILPGDPVQLCGAGRVTSASACCRCWSTRRHGASRSRCAMPSSRRGCPVAGG
eukprot:76302-Chlamydomonas_euryale.AAC.1